MSIPLCKIHTWDSKRLHADGKEPKSVYFLPSEDAETVAQHLRDRADFDGIVRVEPLNPALPVDAILISQGRNDEVAPTGKAHEAYRLPPLTRGRSFEPSHA